MHAGVVESVHSWRSQFPTHAAAVLRAFDNSNLVDWSLFISLHVVCGGWSVQYLFCTYPKKFGRSRARRVEDIRISPVTGEKYESSFTLIPENCSISPRSGGTCITGYVVKHGLHLAIVERHHLDRRHTCRCRTITHIRKDATCIDERKS